MQVAVGPGQAEATIARQGLQVSGVDEPAQH